MSTTTDPNPLYGLWCDADKCWYGGAKGGSLPSLYSDTTIKGEVLTGEFMAKMAATIMAERFKGKKFFRAKIYDGTAQRIRDSVTPPLSTLQALNRIEQKAKTS